MTNHEWSVSAPGSDYGPEWSFERNILPGILFASVLNSLNSVVLLSLFADKWLDRAGLGMDD